MCPFARPQHVPGSGRAAMAGVRSLHEPSGPHIKSGHRRGGGAIECFRLARTGAAQVPGQWHARARESQRCRSTGELHARLRDPLRLRAVRGVRDLRPRGRQSRPGPLQVRRGGAGALRAPAPARESSRDRARAILRAAPPRHQAEGQARLPQVAPARRAPRPPAGPPSRRSPRGLASQGRSPLQATPLGVRGWKEFGRSGGRTPRLLARWGVVAGEPRPYGQGVH